MQGRLVKPRLKVIESRGDQVWLRLGLGLGAETLGMAILWQCRLTVRRLRNLHTNQIELAAIPPPNFFKFIRKLESCGIDFLARVVIF